jgi:macrolide-specific efflux system membrane fusion protein
MAAFTKSNPPSRDGWIVFEKCPVFALESIELSTQETGIIASIAAQENDAVQANQVIGKIEAKTAELEKNVASLQLQVAVAEAQDESEIRLAEAFVEEAQLQVDLYEEMANKGTASSSDVRSRLLALSQAKVRVTQAKASKTQKELKAKLAQATYEISQQKNDRMQLRSPIEGTVVQIHHRPGEWVQSGTAIAKIIRLNEVRVDCFVDLDQIDPTKLKGSNVKIIARRDDQERLFVGKVASFDPDVSSIGKIRVHTIVQNQKAKDDWLLLPGMTVAIQMQKP